MMTTKEIRQLDLKAIRKEIKTAKLDITKEEIKIHMDQDKNTSSLRPMRKYIARLVTVLNEKVFLLQVNQENGKENIKE